MAVDLRKVVLETLYHSPDKNFELVKGQGEMRYVPFYEGIF